MANVKLLFCGIDKSVFEDSSIECFANIHGNISIIIEEHNDTDYLNYKAIVLDRETAIRFAKELRKQIALISNEKGI